MLRDGLPLCLRVGRLRPRPGLGSSRRSRGNLQLVFQKNSSLYLSYRDKASRLRQVPVMRRTHRKQVAVPGAHLGNPVRKSSCALCHIQREPCQGACRSIDRTGLRIPRYYDD